MIKFDDNNQNALISSIQNGLLFIPDISGYSQLVHSTDLFTAKQITYELLSTLINTNQLNMILSEVEGDAILFYRYGEPPAIEELLEQYNAMVHAFEHTRLLLEEKLSTRLHVSLKVIAHYGLMTEYKIGPFKKLFGEVVVQAHRLLKNSIESHSYLLLTDSLIERSNLLNEGMISAFGLTKTRLCEYDSNNHDICFTYFSTLFDQQVQHVAC